ncbi:MAG: mechanosensitive ion channel family protein [Verrucomicrobiota bacterium]
MSSLLRFGFVALCFVIGSLAYGQDAPAEATPAPTAEEVESGDGTALKYTEGKLWLREKLSELFDFDRSENTLIVYIACFVIVLLTFVANKIVTLIFSNWLHRIAEKTAWTFDDQLIPAMKGPVGWMVNVIGFFLAVSILALPASIDETVLRIFQASTLTVAFWGILRFVDVLAEALVDVAKERDMGVYHFIPLIKKAARTFLIVIAVILVVQNLGYNVGSLLAGLGIGGLAIALAAQESLGNFFGSVSLVADRPFKVGDWIQVGSEVDGDVEEIGLRSTKVRTWTKSQLTIPNKVLANKVIINWSRMPKRRVKQYIGVTYSTSAENMDGLVEDIRALLREDEGVHQEFILVNFTDFGDSSLQILVYYFTKTIKWLEHMDVRQRINLKIMKAVEGRGSSFAFPTRTVHFEGDLAEQYASGPADSSGS